MSRKCGIAGKSALFNVLSSAAVYAHYKMPEPESFRAH